MSRETLKSELVKAIGQHKDRLMNRLLSEVRMDEGRPERNKWLSRLNIECAMATILADALNASQYDPFMDYHVQYADGTTVYQVGDVEIDIISDDIDSFVLRVIEHMVEHADWLAHEVMSPGNINTGIITVMDKVLHKKGKIL